MCQQVFVRMMSCACICPAERTCTFVSTCVEGWACMWVCLLALRTEHVMSEAESGSPGRQTTQHTCSDILRQPHSHWLWVLRLSRTAWACLDVCLFCMLWLVCVSVWHCSDPATVAIFFSAVLGVASSVRILLLQTHLKIVTCPCIKCYANGQKKHHWPPLRALPLPPLLWALPLPRAACPCTCCVSTMEAPVSSKENNLRIDLFFFFENE